MSTRPNYAEGKFYPSVPKQIDELLNLAVESQKNKIKYKLKDKRIIGGVSPHSAHTSCATEAVHLFEIIKESGQKFDTIVLIAPNHTGYGEPISIDSHTQWSSPLGTIDIDVAMAQQMELPTSPDAQRYEHSAEVIVPFIQHFLGHNFKLLPITIMDQNLKNAQLLAQRIKNKSEQFHQKILVIASSDFTHFKTSREGYALDNYALEALEAFDLEAFEQRVKSHHIPICGYGTILTLMEYARLISPQAKIKVLARGHSGETVPYSTVVDYVSILAYA